MKGTFLSKIKGIFSSFNPFGYNKQIMETIDYKEATIIDVRETYECEMGMVEGSLNMPLGEVPYRIQEIKEMKKPVILCCRSGSRSGQAVDFLKSHGLDEMYNGGPWQHVQARLTE